MYIRDGIAYAGDESQTLSVVGVETLENYKLRLRFSDNEIRIFDFKKLLDEPAFMPLRNKDVFDSVYIDFDTIAWNNGEIDISSEYLYENGISEKAS